MGLATDVCKRAAQVAPELARLSTAKKDAALESIARALVDSTPELVKANEDDLEAAESSGTPAAVLDRLRLTEARVEAMATGLRAVARQPDPVGEVIGGWTRSNGLVIERVRVPLGVVAVIYEGRPNVTSDVAGLCIKSGNACVLRGSAIALRSNRAIANVIREALGSAGAPPDAAQMIDDPSRTAAVELMRATGLVDLLVPRGGPDLIARIEESATVPYIVDGDGNCHVYVDASADDQTATNIVINAKTQRPSVCNAAETLLVHREKSDKWLPSALDELARLGVEIRGDGRVRALWPNAIEATEEDWATEYLDLVLTVGIVDSIDDAITHIDRYGTSNSEAIVTSDVGAARRFAAEIEAGSVMVNASTRFSDGGEFGYGAEIGVSTQKLHARGPMGLRALTSTKHVVWGSGQVRS
jgi:glutamate-5-semialdehyde dehydrogenase